MPFLSEEIWHIIEPRNKSESLVVSSWPVFENYNNKILKNYETVKQIVGAVRHFRKENNINQNELLSLFYYKSNSVKFIEVISRLAKLNKIELSDPKNIEKGGAFRIGTNQFFIPLNKKIDSKKETFKINEELRHLEIFLASTLKKLANIRFVENAPSNILELERKKASDSNEKIKNLKRRLDDLV